MIKLLRKLAVVSGAAMLMGSLGWANPGHAQMREFMEVHMPLQGTVESADMPSGVQRVDITRSGDYQVLGDNSPGLIGGLQPAAGNVDEVKRMNIVASPHHLKVVTGVPLLEPQPVAFQTAPSYGNPIDVYFDKYIELNASIPLGAQPTGYIPFPQTPDITVNPMMHTVTIDNHINP